MKADFELNCQNLASSSSIHPSKVVSGPSSADPVREIYATVGKSSRPSKLLTSALLAFTIILSGCSGLRLNAPGSQITSSNRQGWLADGAITIARSAPLAQALEPSTMLGFLPGTVPALASPVERVGTWLSVDRAQRSISLHNGTSEVAKFEAEGIDKLKPGVFPIVLKQRSPLWYAPDAYFAARNLSIPARGDKTRFRRGALGDFVIFLDKATPLHSGPIWVDEIGGLRLDENDLSRIYYQLDVGSLIEVK